MRVAIVHDWLDTWRGGENVLAEIAALYPDADLFALVDFLPAAERARLGGRRATTSYLQRLPGARRHFRKYLPLFPRAIASLDVGAYDVVISISHAVAKGVRIREGQRHFAYCLTPMRYAWDLRDTYFRRGTPAAWLRPLADPVLDRIRDWDRASNDGVTEFAAISAFIAERIARHYARPARVIHPPVDTDWFTPGAAPPSYGFYLAASHWVPYKRLDAVVAAFAGLPERRLVVAGSGPDVARVQRAAPANVAFAGAVPRAKLRDLMRDARAFVFAAEEDFGIAPLEAQACGTPVIAYGRGGVTETIVATGEHPTGAFFGAQSAEAIATAVRAFEARSVPIDAAACRANAERFGTARFRREIADWTGVPAAPAAAATP
ncbi:MAG TPA: glycosyltransferase [Casimicrobiaceae bacterium]|nr:glycosyltransferase [Casimicrobiaceae bacterium]